MQLTGVKSEGWLHMDEADGAGGGGRSDEQRGSMSCVSSGSRGDQPWHMLPPRGQSILPKSMTSPLFRPHQLPSAEPMRT